MKEFIRRLKKLPRFVKYNKLVIAPVTLFTIFMALGLIHKQPIMIVSSSIFFIFLFLSLYITLKNY